MAEDKAAESERRESAKAGQWLRRDFLKFGREERFAESFALALPLYWNNYYTINNAEEMSGSRDLSMSTMRNGVILCHSPSNPCWNSG
jgi:hypothetical protein